MKNVKPVTGQPIRMKKRIYETQKERLAGTDKAKTGTSNNLVPLDAICYNHLFSGSTVRCVPFPIVNYFHACNVIFITKFYRMDDRWPDISCHRLVPKFQCVYSRNHILVIADIGCRNMRSRNRDTGDTDRNKGYRII